MFIWLRLRFIPNLKLFEQNFILCQFWGLGQFLTFLSLLWFWNVRNIQEKHCYGSVMIKL